MKTGSITYNGTNSLELGVYTTGSGSFDAAELDVDKYEVAGRNGDVIIPKNRYKNINCTYTAFIPKQFGDKVQSVRNWLRSAKVYARLEDTYDMDHFRMGLASGVQSFEPTNRNDGANFEMTFDCKPQRFLKVGETPETVEADVQTESGEIVTFETVAESPMTSAEVSLSPIQSLNGYDSPWPGGGGKNKCSYDTAYTPTAGIQNNMINLFSLTLAAGTYTFSCKQSENVATSTRNTLAVKVGSNASQYESISANYNPTNLRHTITFTVSEESTVVFSIWCHTPSTAATYNEWQIEIGSTATAYAPYSNICPITGHTGAELYIAAEYDAEDKTTYSVTFTDQGTVYGGTYDFVSGKLVVTHANIASYNGEALPGRWLSDRDVYAAGTTPTTGAQVVYELATPVEYTLSPQQLTTLLGQNVVWSGAGEITLTYAEPFNVENPTIFEARPLFIITNPNQGDALSVSGKTITFVDSFTGTVTIDCETMDCYAGFSNMNYLITATDFPVLGEGTSIVTWSGSGECKMIPRWWEL